MAERKRNKEIHFYVTEEERKLIRRKMIESKNKNMGAYLRKMAIDGYIVNTDTHPLLQFPPTMIRLRKKTEVSL